VNVWVAKTVTTDDVDCILDDPNSLDADLLLSFPTHVGLMEITARDAAFEAFRDDYVESADCERDDLVLMELSRSDEHVEYHVDLFADPVATIRVVLFTAS
jgi:flagellar biosynthesis regulator FlbT